MVKWKNPINKIKLHEVNYATDKTVSYSQYATWRACNYQWYLAYAQNNAVYSQSIHTVFGTAIHNTLQYYIDYIFNISGKKADGDPNEESVRAAMQRSFPRTNGRGQHSLSQKEAQREHSRLGHQWNCHTGAIPGPERKHPPKYSERCLGTSPAKTA